MRVRSQEDAGISANLARLRERVGAACARAGRSPDSVRIIAITKTRPASDVRLVAGTGLADVGENRAAELAEKVGQCADEDLTWHFVGQLQTNKAGLVARHADWVHSVDRARLARVLAAKARAQQRELTALAQVNLDPDAAAGELGPRGGCHPADLMDVAGAIAEEAGLRLGGIMAVAPHPASGVSAASAFEHLHMLASRLRARYPQATAVSAGMSGDLEEAVEHGATHLRIGTALLGDREPIVG